MITCPKCGKDNQGHYKFCLGCGTELPRENAAARPFQPTPPAGTSKPALTPSASAPVAAPAVTSVPATPPSTPFASPASTASTPFVPTPAAAPAAAPAPAAAAPVCPQCSTPNTRNTRFCVTCGFDMRSVPAAAAPAASPAPAAPPVAATPAPVVMPQPTVGAKPSRARLILIRPDGTEGGSYTLPEGQSAVGRTTDELFASDVYLSPQHVGFTVNGQTVTARNLNSLNGVYLRIERQAPVEIAHNEIFRIGQEILRYEAFSTPRPEADGTERQGAQIEGLIGKISLLVDRNVVSNAFPIPYTGLFLGRERGDILFPDDGYVSGLHCQLSVEQSPEGRKLMLTDVGSSNGTYIRLLVERQIRNNDLLLLGQQLFRLTIQ